MCGNAPVRSTEQPHAWFRTTCTIGQQHTRDLLINRKIHRSISQPSLVSFSFRKGMNEERYEKKTLFCVSHSSLYCTALYTRTMPTTSSSTRGGRRPILLARSLSYLRNSRRRDSCSSLAREVEPLQQLNFEAAFAAQSVKPRRLPMHPL